MTDSHENPPSAAVTAFGKARQAAVLRVLHGLKAIAAPEDGLAQSAASCANCGAPLPTRTTTGRPRRDARYCSSTCRLAATRARRSTALAEVRAAAVEFEAAAGRLVAALRVLGVMPSLTRPMPPRRRGRR